MLPDANAFSVGVSFFGPLLADSYGRQTFANVASRRTFPSWQQPLETTCTAGFSL
jgi:hypothetical protein